MTKKIGIVTINDYNNYGNRLQNYAVQEVIKSLGFYVETIIKETSITSNDSSRPVVSKFKKMLKLSYQERYLLIKTKINMIINKKRRIQRIKSFKDFSSRNIKEIPFSISLKNIPHDLASGYDYFIVGSDQVWNPIFGSGTSIDFLTFVPKKKRIAYAPSFGISYVPDEHVNDYKLWLSEMEYLSVREEAGAIIIKELTDRDAKVLIDPTLMINKEKWLSIAKGDSEKPNERFLLTYFLGNIPKAILKKIKRIALENNLDIINLADIKDKKRYVVDPSGFIDYINSAEILFTNSFHGAVFSIILEKPFIVLDRDGINSRIDTLLSKFKMEDRRWINIINEKDVFNIDFSHVSSIIETERTQALDYLKNALGIKEAN